MQSGEERGMTERRLSYREEEMLVSSAIGYILRQLLALRNTERKTDRDRDRNTDLEIGEIENLHL